MLSRMTNALLLMAVAALSVALVRSHNLNRQAKLDHAQSLDAVQSVDRVFEQVDASRGEEALLAAAMSPFDSVEFQLAQNVARNDKVGADSPRDRSRNGQRGRGPQTFTDEMVDRCIEVAAEVDSDLATRLSEARARNPQEFDEQMRSGGFGRRLWALAQLKTHDPRLYDDKVAELALAVQIDRAAKNVRELRSAEDASLSELQSAENKLQALLQVQVALSIKARGEMLCRFEDRARELHAELDREARNFQATVEARMAALTAPPRESENAAGESGDDTTSSGG